MVTLTIERIKEGEKVQKNLNCVAAYYNHKVGDKVQLWNNTLWTVIEVTPMIYENGVLKFKN